MIINYKDQGAKDIFNGNDTKYAFKPDILKLGNKPLIPYLLPITYCLLPIA